MATVYIYADETGNLDYSGAADPRGGGASTYFGFGTAVFSGDHGKDLLEGLHARARTSQIGVDLVARGFHAGEDSHRTRTEMFEILHQQAPRIDSTFLLKRNAYEYVRRAGDMRLYKLAWYLHFKGMVFDVASPEDEIYVIVAAFGTKARKKAAQAAIRDVCDQTGLNITLCIWQASTSWGLQIADYALWSTQRVLEGKRCTWHEPCVAPHSRPPRFPWGRHEH